MKIKIIIAGLFVFLTLNSQAQQVEIKSSRLHGLLVFVYSNMNRPHYTPYLKEITDNSEYKDQVKAILADSAGIEKNMSQGINYSDAVKGYGDGFGVDDLFEIQSAYAKDIDDLFIRLQNTLPMDEHLKFKKILKAMDPIYEKLIWSQHRSKLFDIENMYQQNAKKWNLSSLFKKTNTFYNTTWPNDLDFLITLYPIPPGAKQSNAHCLAAFESVGVIIDEKDHIGRFGVIFHEMMHSLYSAQPIEFKKELLSYYELDKKDADLPYRKGAHKFANEVFATVLGNGWFYEVVSGKKDESSWYNEKHIETVARAMFDTTKTYLDQNKKIDKEYINQYILMFKKSFPNYAEEKDYLFQEVDIFHTNKTFQTQEIRKAFRSNFRSSDLGITGSSTLFTEKLEMDKNRTNLFILSDKEASKMTVGFRNQIDLPKKVQTQILKGKTGLWKWVDKNKNLKAIAVIKIEDLNSLFKQDFNAF